MAIRLGDTAPNFTAITTQGELNFHEWLGDSWGLLFSHPADYTPVCTTELGMTAKLKDDFEQRNVKAIAVSVDGLDSHNGWKRHQQWELELECSIDQELAIKGTF